MRFVWLGFVVLVAFCLWDNGGWRDNHVGYLIGAAQGLAAVPGPARIPTTYRKLSCTRTRVAYRFDASRPSLRRSPALFQQRESSVNSEYTERYSKTFSEDRRQRLKLLVTLPSIALITTSPGGFPFQIAWAATTTSLVELRSDMVQALETLQKLLDNWERAVIDCTYADVPRELLEQKNKELLLEKASTFALFDKSVSVISCKTVVGTVRDYLGRTGIGPVAGLEAKLKQAVSMVVQDSNVDDLDALDEWIQTVEEVQRELNRADTLAYSARRDFTSMNNFDPQDTSKILADTESNLAH